MTKGRSQHQFLHDLPESFRHERQDLIEAELDNWQALCQLGDLQLGQIVRKGRSSARICTACVEWPHWCVNWTSLHRTLHC